MTRPGRTLKGGYVNPSKLPKGPNGRACCRYCGTEVPIGRRTFCSAPCIHEWQIRTNPGYAAAQVQKRDKGICAMCGIDCLKLLREMRRLRGEALSEFRAKHRIPAHRSRRVWDMDHIVPVVEGGGSCDLSNLQTLCTSCHLDKTKELMAKRRSKG